MRARRGGVHFRGCHRPDFVALLPIRRACVRGDCLAWGLGRGARGWAEQVSKQLYDFLQISTKDYSNLIGIEDFIPTSECDEINEELIKYKANQELLLKIQQGV